MFDSGSGNKAYKTVINSSKNNKFKNLTFMLNIKFTKEPIFITTNVKKTFNYLKQAFIKVLILLYLNLKSHFQIKTNASCYVIGEVLS